jgi:hypothetical protein
VPAAPIPEVAELVDVPVVPIAPDEVDPVTPLERFPDALDGIALDSTKSLPPSRMTHPVNVTC